MNDLHICIDLFITHLTNVVTETLFWNALKEQIIIICHFLIIAHNWL